MVQIRSDYCFDFIAGKKRRFEKKKVFNYFPSFFSSPAVGWGELHQKYYRKNC